LEEEVVVPGGAEALAFDAGALVRVLSPEVKGEMAQDRKGLGGMARSDPALVLGEDNIEHPVEFSIPQWLRTALPKAGACSGALSG
jgi:hypothetical protein